ncbi:preprotein translocase subunit YajC [Lapillicoccus sp.]|uniref:preprotein translocase subunit YajC n=1 Tax=Lapillicoccus sp. TaxID=1909287 RepID=UPI0025D415B0|nr:preprotein translocase subunit YajC [Lapillicoccus sp.]
MPNQGLGALLLPFLLILLVGFMFWSQRRRQRAAVDLQSSIDVGDEVCTTSGLFGRVVAMDDLVMHLEIAPGTVVKFDRRAVAIRVDTSTTGSTTAVDLSKTPATTATTATTDVPASPVDEK